MNILNFEIIFIVFFQCYIWPNFNPKTPVPYICTLCMYVTTYIHNHTIHLHDRIRHRPVTPVLVFPIRREAACYRLLFPYVRQILTYSTFLIMLIFFFKYVCICCTTSWYTIPVKKSGSYSSKIIEYLYW